MTVALFLEGQKDYFDSFLQHLSHLNVGFLVRDSFLTPVSATGPQISLTHTYLGDVDNISASCKDVTTLRHTDCSCAKGLGPSPWHCVNS